MPANLGMPLGFLSTFIYQGLLKIVSSYGQYIQFTEVASINPCISVTTNYFLSIEFKCALIQTADEVD